MLITCKKTNKIKNKKQQSIPSPHHHQLLKACHILLSVGDVLHRPDRLSSVDFSSQVFTLKTRLKIDVEN
jgi:hypothetical protein